jgi:transposase
MAQRQKFSLDFREQAVRRVIDGPRPIVDVAKELKIHEGTLSNWVRQYRDEHPVEEKPLTASERARLVELEKENRELRQKSEFLGKAAAFFAQEYR